MIMPELFNLMAGPNCPSYKVKISGLHKPRIKLYLYLPIGGLNIGG
jgi:hypothetical protein